MNRTQAGVGRLRRSSGLSPIVVLAGMLLIPPACHEPGVVQPPAEGETSATKTEASKPATELDATPELIDIPDDLKDQDRWLFVEKAIDDAPGAWATGSFDPKRNKLSIGTHQVQQFAVDLSRIRIQWERLVILGIDGINSELRKRDQSLLHFARDQRGEWIVLEP